MDSHASKIAYALSFAAQLGFLIVFPLVGFIWLGVFLDGLWHAAPSFLLTGLVVGLAVTSFETYHLLEPLLGGDKPDEPDQHRHA